MTTFFCEVLPETPADTDQPECKEYFIKAPNADIACLLAFMLDGGISGAVPTDPPELTTRDEPADYDGLLALAQSYTTAIALPDKEPD